MKLQKSSIIRAIVFSAITAFSLEYAAAVDWPQQVQTKDDFSVEFARPCGNTFSTGIIFANTDTVKASDTATVLLQLEPSDSLSMFDSPLGNAIIAVNEENLMNTYANLDELKIAKDDYMLVEGEEIAVSGKSGWQKEPWGLEFKIADIQSQTVINPLVLLPKIIETEVPHLYNISLVNKNGLPYNLTQNKALPAGTYNLYFEGYDPEPPFKVTVLINGKEAETITYNMLKKIGRSLFVGGKRNYAFDAIFAGQKKQLLATTSLTKGKTLLVIQSFYLNGNERNISYTLDIY